MKRPIVAAIAAIGKNRELGKDNKLIWKIPDDLKRFKELTIGHPVILGRKTFESILKYISRPLPNRSSIVITREPKKYMTLLKPQSHPDLQEGQVYFVESIEEAIEKGKQINTDKIFIGGGTQIFEAALPQTDKLYLTLVDATADADSFFPPYETEFTKKTFEESHEWNGIKYRFVDLERA